MPNQTGILERLNSDAQKEKENLIRDINQYETGKLHTQAKNGNEPWIDTTDSNLKKSRIDLEMVEVRLARYADLLK